MSTESTSEEHGEGVKRRDFLYIATAGFGAIAAGSMVWPLIDNLNPAADVLALASIEVDLSAVEVGQSILARWRGKPVFIRRRTEEEVAEAQAVPLGDLKDPQTDEERTLSGREEWLVMVGICTHLGCVPLGTKAGENRGDYGGWFCPCHGSHYDTSGRIRKGPAPANLEIPEYAFLDDTTIQIG
ncbi:MAG: ubiquinol-cytochrome c reductase iron-sulfur subunit [Alphaproteobacteria bacterium]